MAVIGSRTPVGGMGGKPSAMVAAGITTPGIAVGVAAAIMSRSGIVSASADMAARRVAPAAAGVAATRAWPPPEAWPPPCDWAKAGAEPANIAKTPAISNKRLPLVPMTVTFRYPPRRCATVLNLYT